MENMGEWEVRSLINELTQGRELTRKLQADLHAPSASNETRELLVLKIQASYEKALSMLNCSASGSIDQPQSSEVAIRVSESPSSYSVSPRSEDSDRDFKEPDQKSCRQALPRWAKHVRVTPGTALEEPLDDGFSWRKYGQKDILGAKYPRGYYRCSHRTVQGCLARKQVQRSDEDPTVFEITYRGTHTCNLASHVMHSSGISENQQGSSNQQTQKHSQDLLLSFRRELEVITQDLDIGDQTYPSFPKYPSSTPPNIKVENNLVLSSPLISPATSSRMNSEPLLGNVGFPNSEAQAQQLTGIYQAASSSTNSPTVGLDFPFVGADQFHPNITFDNNGFFS